MIVRFEFLVVDRIVPASDPVATEERRTLDRGRHLDGRVPVGFRVAADGFDGGARAKRRIEAALRHKKPCGRLRLAGDRRTELRVVGLDRRENLFERKRRLGCARRAIVRDEAGYECRCATEAGHFFFSLSVDLSVDLSVAAALSVPVHSGGNPLNCRQSS